MYSATGNSSNSRSHVSPDVPGSPQAASSPKVPPPPKIKRNKIKDSFKIAIMNFQSISNKLPEFHTLLSATDPDVVLGTETWLKPDTLNCEVFPENYTIYRRDRRTDRSTDIKRGGGGVCILVRKSYTSSEIKVNTECELLFVDLQLKDQKNVKIGCLYRPPWTDEEYLEDLQNVLQQVDPDRRNNVWLGGDYNLPHVDWTEMKTLPNNPNIKLSNFLINTVKNHSLFQIVDIPTRKENTLDLFFTTNPSLVNRVTTVPPLTKEADHDVVFVDVNSRAAVPKQKPTTKLLYDKADWDTMRQEMTEYSLPAAQSVQKQWDHLENLIQQLMKKHIPSKISRPQKHKPWITREIITLIHRRNRAFITWKKLKTEKNLKTLNSLKAESQQKVRKAHQDYLQNIFEVNTPSDNDKTLANKRFWTYVKSRKKDTCSVSPLKAEGVLISDAAGKSNILNKQYCSVFTKEDSEDIPSKGPSQAPIMSPITVTAQGVEKLLQKLKTQKASGPDRISPRVLKELAGPLSVPLAALFQHSLDTGTVPAQWKKAVVSPIFKKGDKHEASNYRPVSLTSVCCKLCEHIVARAVMDHLEEEGLLCDNQHGFRKRRSCETQLLQFIDELARSMSNGKQVDVAVMDFSKAFDVVPHKRLSHKLHFYGIRGNTLKWIEDFLRNRTQQVVIDGEASSTAPVTSGVPQGSVLGPILFLAFINDMPESVKSMSRLFADDSIIYREVTSPDSCQQLQDDLKALEDWERKWGMSFNPSKCHIIHISRKKNPIKTTYRLKGKNLEAVDSATYLGVEISSDLSWKKHISKVTAKGNRTLGFIKRNITSANPATKEMAYKTLVRPTLEYSATVWSPHQQELIKAVDMVQRRAARYVLRSYRKQASVTDMLHTLKWDTLEQRRLKARVVMTYRIVHNQVRIPSDQFIPSTTTTRGHSSKFRQIVTRTNYYKATFFPSAIPLWNSLSSAIVSSPTLDDFKDKIKDINLKTN